jgi:hypothetical protein
LVAVALGLFAALVAEEGGCGIAITTPLLPEAHIPWSWGQVLQDVNNPAAILRLTDHVFFGLEAAAQERPVSAPVELAQLSAAVLAAATAATVEAYGDVQAAAPAVQVVTAATVVVAHQIKVSPA